MAGCVPSGDERNVMKIFFLGLVFSLVSVFSFAQKTDYNRQDGFAAAGYDVVAYFDQQAKEGKAEFQTSFDGVNYKFSNSNNLKEFQANPQAYIPQYGGWCAYAMAVNNSKVTINPKTFEIRDGKLYLFYNAYFTNTLKSWRSEGPEKLREKADQNWLKLKFVTSSGGH